MRKADPEIISIREILNNREKAYIQAKQLAIRNGILTFDELIEKVKNYDQLFEELYENSKLPKSPNRKKIDELCIKLIKKHLTKGGK